MDCRVLKTGKCEVSQKYKGTAHNGIDLVGAGYTLADVVAHSAGTVVGVVSNCNRNTSKTGERIYGNYVKIKHDNGMYTLYAHLKYGSVAVSLNQRVEKGQVLGYMGNTGYSFGAHLHFEVRNISNVQIDPTPYVDAELLSSQTVVQPATGTYTVVEGDILSKIAQKYGTTVTTLIELNKAKYPKIAESNGSFIRTGWVLNMPSNSTNNVTSNTTTNTVKYKVNSGNGLWLLDANGKKIKAYVKDTEVEYLGAGYTKYGYNYIKVKVLNDSKIGYMAKTYLG